LSYSEVGDVPVVQEIGDVMVAQGKSAGGAEIVPRYGG
jgi:hypothetical protein